MFIKKIVSSYIFNYEKNKPKTIQEILWFRAESSAFYSIAGNLEISKEKS